ncbi:beta-1,3-galactosyltransferase 1-like [Centruroides vittatus]|uniref:beta-1,3-galactosyltransferase 1-like n=1 Tax=Centruroides vittatus TaxID=120091 RepID=UPI00351025C2
MIEYCTKFNKLLPILCIISFVTIIFYSLNIDKEYILKTSVNLFRNLSLINEGSLVTNSINRSFFKMYDDENKTIRFNISDSFNDSETKIVNAHPYKFIINHFGLCVNNGNGLSLLITVISAVTHFEERRVIRETWGGYARKLGAKLIFFIGHPYQENLQSDIVKEDGIHHDIIQENFFDSYLNLTIKTISILKWVSKYCYQVKLVLKIDDDNFLNVDRLFKFVNDTVEAKSMYGLLAHQWKPSRDPENKWFMPVETFPNYFYPDFLAGPAYLFTGDCAPILYEESLKTVPLHLEDVFVTGILAEATGVKRLRLIGVNNLHQIITPCSYKTMINSHEHSAKDIRRLWSVVHGKFFICFSY